MSKLNPLFGVLVCMCGDRARRERKKKFFFKLLMDVQFPRFSPSSLYTLIWYIFNIFRDRFKDVISIHFDSMVVYLSFDFRCTEFGNVMIFFSLRLFFNLPGLNIFFAWHRITTRTIELGSCPSLRFLLHLFLFV